MVNETEQAGLPVRYGVGEYRWRKGPRTGGAGGS